MISDFHTLSDKIDQLAELTRSLRGENAELRLRTAALTADNLELARRMQQAHDRVAAVLAKLPVSEQEQDEEAA